jgi:hypothetical protein
MEKPPAPNASITFKVKWACFQYSYKSLSTKTLRLLLFLCKHHPCVGKTSFSKHCIWVPSATTCLINIKSPCFSFRIVISSIASFVDQSFSFIFILCLCFY